MFQAVERKQTAQQLAQQKKYEVEASRTRPPWAPENAARVEAEKANAEGQAQALRIRGAAEAEYNARVAQSLSPVLIQQQYLQKWNGQLPQYQLGGSGTLINLPAPK